MREQCNTCAYRVGCVTHEDEPHNRLKAEIAVAAALPFYCHQGTDWRNIKSSRLTPDQAMALRRTMPVCEGWRQAVAKAAAEGRYVKGTARIRRLAGTRALLLIDQAIAAGADLKHKLFGDLERTLVLLANLGPKRRRARGVRR